MFHAIPNHSASLVSSVCFRWVSNASDDLLALDEPQAAIVQIAWDDALAILGPLFSDPAILKIGHNLKYDAHVLARAMNGGVRLHAMVVTFTSWNCSPERDRPGATSNDNANESC